MHACMTMNVYVSIYIYAPKNDYPYHTEVCLKYISLLAILGTSDHKKGSIP